jgi:heat shock protein HslJ
MPPFARAAIALALVMAAAGCSNEPEKLPIMPPPEPAQAVPVESIANHKWVVDSVSPSVDNAFDWSRLGISINLDSASKRASGYGGCNRWSAGYTSSEPGNLSFTAPISTRMACMEPAGVMAMEQAFLDRLSKIAAYTRSEDHLYLQSEDGASGMVLILDNVGAPP